jgi:lysophospholipase L1-like esterase
MTAVRTATASFDLTGNGASTSVNAGGTASGSFVADAWYSGGSTYSTSNAIDTSQLASPVPPQAVLQSERYGEFTYTVPNRAPNTAQTVTLYFAESYWTAAGQRTFNVAINGVAVLTAFDIYAAAGANRAIARTFETTANSSGQVVIAFTKGGGPDNPKVCGITVSGAGSTSYTLTVTRSGSGSGTVTGGGVNCGSVCSANVASGTTVTLTAAAASGSTFGGWSGACGGAASTCVVSMTGAQSVTAQFGGGGAYNPCPASGDCRILPFGDSITDGFNVPGGYRIPLFSTGRAAGKHLTFVGSLVNGPTTVDGVAFPRNHEGHSGWTISQITGLVPSPALNTPPHIVLLMIGTNDMYGSSSGVPAAVQRLDALLGKLVSAAPNALVVVAQITPLGDSAREALVRSYNGGLPAIVNARAAQGQHVVLVDMHTGFPTSELADGTHPNSAGYARMARVWYAAIGSLLR